MHRPEARFATAESEDVAAGPHRPAIWQRAIKTSRNPFCWHVGALLVQRQAGGAAIGIGLEGNLGVDNLVEEVALALRKNLDLGLAGGLGKELVAFAGDGQDEVRPQLVLADVSVEKLRINGNLLVLLGRRQQGRVLSLPIEIILAARYVPAPCQLWQACEESIHFAQDIRLVRQKNIVMCMRQSNHARGGYPLFECVCLFPELNLVTRFSCPCGWVTAECRP